MSGKVFSEGPPNPLNRPMPNLSRAACVGYDPALFFTEKNQAHMVAQAKAICGSCPVMVACREYAVDTKQKTGIWGGTSPMERRALRRQKLRSL